MVTEIALAAGTLLLAAFALWQVLISRRTARQQLRAYVIFDGGSIKLQQLQGQTFFEAYVRLKNFGQTPAYNHSSWVRIEVRDASRPPFAPWNGLTKNILAPAGESNLPVYCGPISAQDLNDIRNERKRIFVWGGADYGDIFGAAWHYEFRCWNEKEMPSRPNQWGLVPADVQESFRLIVQDARFVVLPTLLVLFERRFEGCRIGFRIVRNARAVGGLLTSGPNVCPNASPQRWGCPGVELTAAVVCAKSLWPAAATLSRRERRPALCAAELIRQRIDNICQGRPGGGWKESPLVFVHATLLSCSGAACALNSGRR
jgi:hypothetical protein